MQVLVAITPTRPRPQLTDLLTLIWWAACRERRLSGFLRRSFLLFPSDFKSAYRQVPGDPAQAGDLVIASWNPVLAC